MREGKDKGASSMDDCNDGAHALGGLSNIDQPAVQTERAPPAPSPHPVTPATPSPPATPPVSTRPPAAPAQTPPKQRDSEPITVPVAPVRSETLVAASVRRALPQFRIPELSGFRAPKSFRIDTTLLSYIARHELYRQALHDKRPFTDKLNDWVKQKMEEEDKILQLAEADVRGIEAELLVSEDPVALAVTTAPEPMGTLTAPLAPTGEVGDEVETQPDAVSATAPPPPPQKKGPSIWDLEKQVKRAGTRANAGTL